MDWQVTVRERSPLERWLRLISLGAKDDELRYSFRYEIYPSAQDSVIREGYLRGKVSLPATRPAAPFAGLIVGVLLLQIILLLAQRVVPARIAVGLLQGTLTGIAIIVLGRITTDFHSPIALDVKDFLGGVVLGLLSQRFFKSLLDFIQEQGSPKLGGEAVREGE